MSSRNWSLIWIKTSDLQIIHNLATFFLGKVILDILLDAKHSPVVFQTVQCTAWFKSLLDTWQGWWKGNLDVCRGSKGTCWVESNRPLYHNLHFLGMWLTGTYSIELIHKSCIHSVFLCRVFALTPDISKNGNLDYPCE